jgi:hypothetical protein
MSLVSANYFNGLQEFFHPNHVAGCADMAVDFKEF